MQPTPFPFLKLSQHAKTWGELQVVVEGGVPLLAGLGAADAANRKERAATMVWNCILEAEEEE